MQQEVTVFTDAELDAALSLYASKKYPLSPEFVLNSDPKGYFRQRARWDLLGLSDHPMVQMMMRTRLHSAMADQINRSASYLDRISHLSDTDSGSFPDLSYFYSVVLPAESSGTAENPPEADDPAHIWECGQSFTEPTGSANQDDEGGELGHPLKSSAFPGSFRTG